MNYSYDSEQRLTNITAGSILNLEYTYNSAQQITQIIESTASLGTRTSAFQYDARDQLTEERFQVSGVGCQNNYVYDKARNRTSSIKRQASNEQTNLYTYVTANKLQSIADEDVAASDADEDGLTRDEEITYGSDPDDADTDDDGLNDNVEVNTYNTCPWKVDSDSDNIPDNTDSNPLKPDNCVWFGASESRPHAWWINSPSKPVYGVGSNKYNYVYDIAGNLKTKTKNSTIVTRYYYNAQNKLVKITGNGFIYEFLYDSQNRRIALSHNGVWKKIIHNGNIPIGELDSTNGISRWFVRGVGIAEGTGDVIAEIDKDGDPHFYLSNHGGDTLVVLNDSGTEQCQLRYDAFGNVVTNTGTFDPKYTFSTKEYLSDCQIYLYEYRVYDPIAGRWTQRDPIDYQDSINLYQFCANNPIKIIDLDGRKNYLEDTDPNHAYNWDLNSKETQFAGNAFYRRMGQLALGTAIATTGIISIKGIVVFAIAAATQAPSIAERGSVVIGQSMTRVTPYATKIGAEYYKGMPGYKQAMNGGAGMLHNALYLGDKMDKGYIIIDIGRDLTKTAPSFYYQMEQSMVKGYENYIQTF